jgi:hypothetical protein
MKEEKQTKRTGKTEITSASLSKEFKDFMEQYDFSPTEAMRRGVAVMLCDVGEMKYITETNLKRSQEIKEFFASLEELNALKQKLIKLKELLEQL